MKKDKVDLMITTFDQALDKIYSYVDYSMTHAKDISGSVFSLDAITQLLKNMKDPQKNFAVIHVAGTKGKGSVCAMLASALQNAGFRTGLYTSPHLIRFNERIIVDGKMINDADVIRLTNQLSEIIDSMPAHVSSFELMTAMAFRYFSEQKVDIAIVETGLGGRLDATNVVTPILSVITSVSYDHTGFLGNTIEKIAAEKAGIIKPGIPVICAFQPYVGAKKVIEAFAQHCKSPWINVPDRFHYINRHLPESGDGMLIWRVEDQKLMEKWCGEESHTGWEPREIRLPLRGLHQMQNAAVVYAVLNKMRSHFKIDMDKAVDGIGETFWPCRFETIAESPVLIVDGAHNSDSIEKLASAIDRFCSPKAVKCIFGASEDKDQRAMIRKLSPHVDEFIMTKSIHPRAADPKVLCGLASEAGRKNRRTDSLEEAYSIYESEKDPDTVYIAAGSLFAAGGIRELHMKKTPSLRYFEYNEPLE